jgi:formamidopyrimidine-DNA glycosylase
MPELPEVETVRRGLAPRFVGRTHQARAYEARRFALSISRRASRRD